MHNDTEKVLIEALQICMRNWGWWNKEDPPIVDQLPKHPIILSILDKVKKEEHAKYES